MDTSVITDELIKQRDEILRLCARYREGNISVFGSMVRGDAGGNSDVDLLVDVTGPTTQWWPGGLVIDLEELLHRKVDVVTERSLNKYIKDEILAEAVAL